MSENPIDHGPERAGSESRSVLRRLSIQAPERLVARIEELERHQAEAAKAINAAMDWLALAPKDDAPIQFSELALSVMRSEHGPAIQWAREQGDKNAS